MVRDGESWAAAARRTSASLSTEPLAVDLSGAVKEFVVDPEVSVVLRAMTREDLDDVTGWLASPALRRWWSEGEVPADPAKIRETYAERIDGLSPTRMWIVEIDGRPAGFVQDYRIGDDGASALPARDLDAIGVDYAIGDDQWRGTGLGARMLWAWMLLAHRRFPDATGFFAAPNHRNAASLRVLAKAGFVPGEEFEETQRDGSVTTMVGCALDVARVLG